MMKNKRVKYLNCNDAVCEGFVTDEETNSLGETRLVIFNGAFNDYVRPDRIVSDDTPTWIEEHNNG